MNKSRKERLMPNGIPRYVHCYDNGGRSIDRYTVVFTGNFKKAPCPMFVEWPYLAMNGAPFHPQGFCQHGATKNNRCDYPRYGHIGKRIKFTDLPEDCQKVVLQDYAEIWGLLLD